MVKIGELLSKLLGIAIAGAVGASVVVFTIDGTDLLGAASGKRVAKNKKQPPVSIWSDVASEVNKGKKVPPPVPQTQQAPEVNLGNITSIQESIDDNPILDPYDPVRCVRNQSTENGAIFSRTFIKGEIRSFHQDFGRLGVVCSADIYPQGCESTTTFEVRSPGASLSMAAVSLCDRLAESFHSRRTVYLQGDKYIEGVEGYISDFYELMRFSAMPQGLDAFVERSNQLNTTEQANRDALAGMLGGGDSLGSKLGGAAAKATSNLGK